MSNTQVDATTKSSTQAILQKCDAINYQGGIDSQPFNPFHTAVDSFHDGKASVDGKMMLMSGSYSYLGLGKSARIKAAIDSAFERYGCANQGSRALTGSTVLHEELESSIAKFLGSDSGVIFTNGYLTNYTTISTLIGPGDSVITELTNHNSIQAGVRASGAKVYSFSASNLATLRKALEKAQGTTSFVVADAIFSMDGTILDLPTVVGLCKEFGAFLMLDEAHSLGVLGSTGRGIVEHFGMDPQDVDLRMATLSKGLTGVGGAVVGDTTITKALSRGAHGYLFTGAPPVLETAAALESLRILDEEPEIVVALQKKAQYLRDGFSAKGLPVWGHDGVPIIPVVYDNVEIVYEMTARLFKEGVFVVPAIYPAVSKKTPRVRFSVTNAHSLADLDSIVDIFGQINDEVDAHRHAVISLS